MSDEQMQALMQDILVVLKKHNIPVGIPEGQEVMSIQSSITVNVHEFQHAGSAQSIEGKRRAKVEFKLIDKRYNEDY
jgi:uncharacterized protein YejL (UPF0352 family)